MAEEEKTSVFTPTLPMECTSGVDVVIVKRLFGRLANRLKPSEVHDRADWVSRKWTVKSCTIANVALNKHQTFAANSVETINNISATVGEIINNDQLMSRLS